VLEMCLFLKLYEFSNDDISRTRLDKFNFQMALRIDVFIQAKHAWYQKENKLFYEISFIKTPIVDHIKFLSSQK